MNDVRAYETTKEWPTFRWLCRAHLKARRLATWVCKRVKTPTDGTLTCDDCRIATHGAANALC